MKGKNKLQSNLSITAASGAALYEPGLNTDVGQFSVEFYVYTSTGWMWAGTILIFLQAAHEQER